MKIFLVTGLPRSRTAWLANFFTWGNTVCFHDPLPDFDYDVGQFVSYVRSLPYENVGISDPGIALHAAFYHLSFPDAKVVIVNRDKPTCITDFAKAFDLTPAQALDGVNRCEEGLELVRSKFKHVKVVDFKDLSDMDTLRSLFNFCCPLETFSDTRVKILVRIKCTVL